MGSKQRTTILDAVVAVLKAEGTPRTIVEVQELIVKRQLYTFRAKDAVGVVRAAVRKHLRSHGGPGQPAARVSQVGPDRYSIV
jgi:hypothetical protein